MTAILTITRGKFDDWLSHSIQNYHFIAPVQDNGKIIYQLIDNHNQIIFDYQRPLFSIKEYFLPKTEVLFHLDFIKSPVAIKENLFDSKQIIFGIRPCDAHGLEAMDASFIKTAPVDKNYLNRRNNSIIIGMACKIEGPTCFCTQIGNYLDDTSGMDLKIDIQDNIVNVYVVTEKGKLLLEENKDYFDNSLSVSIINNTHFQDKKLFETGNLLDHFSDKFWNDVGDRCVSCRACAYVCPTCRCFDVLDEVSEEDPAVYNRIRCWDSCSGENYRRIAGGHNPRQETSTRIRNRYYCKFYYYPLRFNYIACTGCGRCIEVCPEKIDITEVVKYLSEVYV